jgi:hypothetical protein
MANTYNKSPNWVSEAQDVAWGTLPTADNSSIGPDLVAWKHFQDLLQKSVKKLH